MHAGGRGCFTSVLPAEALMSLSLPLASICFLYTRSWDSKTPFFHLNLLRYYTHTPDVADVPPDAFSKLVGLGVAERFLIIMVWESWSDINHCL